MKKLFICLFMLSSLSILAAEKQKEDVKLNAEKIDSCTVTIAVVDVDGTSCQASGTASTCAEAEKIAKSRICC